jgi:hypothetical protein
MKYVLFLSIVFAMSFAPAGKNGKISVKNTLGFARHEVVVIPGATLKEWGGPAGGGTWLVKERTSGKPVLSQGVDLNGDGLVDELVFEATLAPNELKEFVAELADRSPDDLSGGRSTHSRIVPERVDDYAWENDLVAFRTYGPEAQRLVDENKAGGTLSSGMDCWLKRVNYPVIEKWYSKYVGGGSYHKDDGEGYDPYHVGASRGCGGIGVWKDDSLYVSKNFISYKKITEGPLRNVFELTYAPWIADGITVNETKRITIDLGSQLYQVEARLATSAPLPNCTIGITLHDKKGTAHAEPGSGWFSYWESIDDSEIGTGVVIDKRYVMGHKDFRTQKKDLSQLYVMAKPVQNKVIYYTGFGWKKAGIITSEAAWHKYLDQFAQRIHTPLQVSFK